MNPSAVQAIKANMPATPVIEGDISALDPFEVLKSIGIEASDVSVVAGGPPCQAFSTIGKRNGLSDHRGTLIYDFIRFVAAIQPKYFIMENVRGLLSMKMSPDGKAGDLFEDIQARFSAIGYVTDTFVINSVNYGCPQIRERVFVIGNRMGLMPSAPMPTHSEKPKDALRPFKTLDDALSSIEEGIVEVMDFSPRKKKYLALVPQGGNWRSLSEDLQKESMGKAFYLKGGRSAFWRRLSYKLPSPTLVTMPNHMSTSLCHPTETRALSVKECAAIQEFPANWTFHGSTSEKYKQIGNAVPVGLGRVMGGVVTEMNQAQTPRPAGHSEHTLTLIRPQVRVNNYL